MLIGECSREIAVSFPICDSESPDALVDAIMTRLDKAAQKDTMSDPATNTPVIIGVGQYAERPDDADYRALSHMDLAGEALNAAIADCRASDDLVSAIDTVAAIRQFEISTPNALAPFGKSDNPPRSIAKRAGAKPERAILEIVGGQGPQKLVGELAADIAEGRSDIAVIVGSEAISTVLALSARNETPDWSEDVGGEIEDRGLGMRDLLDRTLITHRIPMPIPVYALYENARRAAREAAIEDYRLEIGRLFAPFSEIAANNPFAAAPFARSPEELATVTERNRIVAEPYTRMTVARDQVNQAAAIVIASEARARELGVAENRWVHIHGVADAREASALGRKDLCRSPASIASVREALGIAGIGIGDIGYLDLYSCFAIAVFNIIDALGIEPDDPRGLTLTGGLPFFGGAGNNYSAHAIVETVQRLRADPQAFALVGANGGFMSKYATGIYSMRPANWSGESRWRTLPNETAVVPVLDDFEGTATIESYTVMPSKRETVAAIVGRTSDGGRFVANSLPEDQGATARLSEGEVFGAPVSVTKAEDGRNQFIFSE